MGVYIKGMKMPNYNYECPFRARIDQICLANYDGVACEFSDEPYRPDNCPLVEVPEPHGDLIDKARLMMHVIDSYLSESVTKEEMNLVDEFVTMARIVIEAEVE